MSNGFRSLFDGKTLTGWRPIPRTTAPKWPTEPLPDLPPDQKARIQAHTGSWTVEDGAICGRQNPPGSGLGGYLLSEEKFGDFELVFEARPDWPADTGVMLRATSLGSQGYQVLIDHRRSGNIGGFFGNGLGHFHGMNFNLDLRRNELGEVVGLRIEDTEKSLVPITPEKRALLKNAASGEEFLSAWHWNDWNEFRIFVRGELPTISTTINGVKIAEIDAGTFPASVFDPRGTVALLGSRGHIAFEIHDNDPKMGEGRWARNAACRWRNVSIREL